MGLRLEDMGYVVADVLELPRRGKKGKAYSIVKAVFKVLKEALQNGEEVYIYGIGRFRLQTKPARKHYLYFYPYLKKKGLHGEVVTLPPRTYVYFDPDDSLIRSLNGTSDPA